MSELEKAVLFYMTEGFEDGRLNESLFASEFNSEIFKAIREARKKNGSPDLISLIEKLRAGHPEIPASYLTGLGEGVIRGQHGESYFRNYVGQLIRLQKERQLKIIIAEIAREPEPLPILKKLLQDWEPEAGDIRELALSGQAAAFRRFIEAKHGRTLWGHEAKSFPVLSRTLMGLREIIVLAAKPKIGKSTFALQLASDLHGAGVSVLYYDMENGALNLMARILSRQFNLSFEELFSGREDRRAPVEGGILRLQDEYKNFFIITDRKLTTDKIAGQVKQAKRLTGRDEVFIVIDSLQKLPMADLRERRAAVDLWLRGFEGLMAENPGLSILLISELSREGGKPKESGDIEYTGHFLLELQANRTDDELAAGGDDGIRKLYVRAARDVQLPAGPLTYETNFRYWRFSEMERPE